MAKAIEWLKRRRSLAAAVAGLYVVFRIARAVFGFGVSFGGFRFLDSAAGFLENHWLLTVGALAVVFLAVFVIVRWVIDWLDRRERSKRQSDSPTAPAG